jgi:hypothetical protein
MPGMSPPQWASTVAVGCTWTSSGMAIPDDRYVMYGCMDGAFFFRLSYLLSVFNARLARSCFTMISLQALAKSQRSLIKPCR